MTPEQMFERIARALCPGDDWMARLADLWGVRRDQIPKWLKGRSPLRVDHFQRLLELLAQRQTEMASAERQLAAWLATQPPDSPR